MIIHDRVKKEQVRLDWLEWARICALEMWAVRERFNVSGREPITESEYRRREKETRKEYMTVDECAEILTEGHQVWDDLDCELDERGERSPTDAAWYRVRGARIDELRGLVAQGTLSGKGKGKHLQIECGSFYDWLGEPVPVAPDLGIAFDVRPDDRAREVARERDDHTFIRKLLDRGACKFDLPLDLESPLAVEPPATGFGLELARALAVALRTGVQENWRELRSVEEQVDAITDDFDGEDVLHPRVRANLDEAKTSLLTLHGDVREYTGPFELPDPGDELRATIQRVVDNEVRHLKLR